MPVTSLSDWIIEFTKPDNLWYVKRLSGNDTLANLSHQAGPYIPKEVVFSVLPSLKQRETLNPRVQLEAFIDSHPDRRAVTAIWYNNRVAADGTRNEVRVTNWGGGASALLDPDSTGALAVFVFVGAANGADASSVHVWVCDGYEDEVIEDRIGPVEPGRWVVWRPGDPLPGGLFAVPPAILAPCRLRAADMPPGWLVRFPTGAEIVRKSVELRPLQNEHPDVRLIQRRLCEYEIFRSVEEALEGQRIAQGFVSIDEFVERALTILQRRKARSGRSLELHAREVLLEEGFAEGIDFSHGPTSEGDKKPDFLFPSEAAYQDEAFPDERLRMLAAKTTLRDRWRQVLNEADRIGRKHVLTLQEGVSENQFAEMEAASVQLVVPESLIESYPEAVQPKLISFRDFLTELRQLAVQV
ncbi:MAG: hypothetical protein QOH81_2025 [Sphingomonadales bacterium]|jgi:hypothetical protein|nr:hypothetical protein [Sphingomonadales bacterium]